MVRMKHVIPLLATGLLAGCAAGDLDRVGVEPRAQISYAATAEYPGKAEKSDQVTAVAVNYPRQKQVEIHNLSDQSIPPSAVWVNGAFVHRVDSIPPRGYVTVKHSDLIEAGPGINDLKRVANPVEKVELQTPEGLFSVLGPAVKD